MGIDSLHWLRTRKRLLQQLKKQVKLRLGGESEDVLHYAQEYKNEFNGRWREVSHQQFQGNLLKATLILGGDFHAFGQSQRSHMRLLRDFPNKDSVILAVECFESRHQAAVDAYITSQKMKEEQFLEAIQWSARWGFPWEHYRPLFELARERKYRVVALNRYFRTRSESNLQKRDIHAAKVLAATRRDYPNHFVYVLFGDLHLAEKHLLKALKEEGALAKEKVLRVFLNSEKLYFRQAKQGSVSRHIVLRGGKDRYCLLTAPPWVKWQSYLMYLEQTYDRDLDEEGGIDYTDHVASLIRLAGDDLGIRLKIQDIAVYGSEDRSLHQISQKLLNEYEMKIFAHLIDRDRSFFIPQGGMFYLSRPTINHAAGLAGQYIQAKLSGRSHTVWDMPNDFIASIWVESVSFFVSKLINSHRMSESLRSIRQELEAGDPRGRGREVLLIVLDQRMSEIIQIHSGRRRSRRYRPPRKSQYLDASRILGNMMGERMFTAFKLGRLPLKSLINLISQDVFSDDFSDIYFQTIRRLESHSAESQKNLVGGSG
ncbi:MAG: ChaN family lipoprotein [Bdellovibrionales bacterium]|nr:ChaN family lipoprotein [Bdellovibrionales bacterium]